MSKQVFAVIHALNKAQVYDNLQLVENVGYDGAFLVSHGEVGRRDLWDIYFQMLRLSRLTLGINQLESPVNQTMVEAYSLSQREGLSVHMLWADNYKRTHYDGPSCPDVVKDYQQRMHKNALTFFGGVAFKYQPEEHLRGALLTQEVLAATPYVDVLTTSGVGTGTAPDLDKIRTMREALGPGSKLAVASGITSDNVDEFLPYVDSFLVSTGISRDFYNLDPVKAYQLIRRVRQ